MENQRTVTGIFCHYLPIYKDINGVYCSTTLTDDLFRRYLKVVDHLLVATRVYPIQSTWQEAHQEKISLEEIEIIEFPNLSDPKHFIERYPKQKKRLDRIIKNVDLIFIRGGIIAQMGTDAAKKYKKPYLVECAGCAWDEYWNYSFMGKLLAPYMEFRAKRDVRDADFVLYVTERWLQNRYPTRGKSTYASNVILEKVEEEALEKRLEKLRLNSYASKPSFVIGTTGGVGNKAKGQQYMIEAMSRLKEKYDIRYELVGGGNREYLTSVAEKYGLKDKVVFKGELTHDEVLQWLDSLDVYIQPSMQEGLPRSLIEAMSRACPAVGSSTAGIPELLDNEAIFRRGKVSSLVKTLDCFLQKDLGKQAKRNFRKSQEYELAMLNARREKLYEQYREYVMTGKD